MPPLLTLENPALPAGCRLRVCALPALLAEAALLAAAPPALAAAGVPAHLTHPQRRREWLAGRLLVANLLADLGVADLQLVADEFGRPQLLTAAGARAGAVSLSHGGGLVAAVVAVGAGYRTGLDLEPERAKTLLLAPRWLAPAELAAVGDVPARAALAWSLKETLYKLYGRRQLDFRHHLALELAAWPAPEIPLPATGTARGRIRAPTDAARHWTHTLHFLRCTPTCWLTYCVSARPDLTPALLSSPEFTSPLN